jgi:hypothetical protein
MCPTAKKVDLHHGQARDFTCMCGGRRDIGSRYPESAGEKRSAHRKFSGFQWQHRRSNSLPHEHAVLNQRCQVWAAARDVAALDARDLAVFLVFGVNESTFLDAVAHTRAIKKLHDLVGPTAEPSIINHGPKT